MGSHLSALDYGLMVAYALALLWIGRVSGRGHQSASDLTLGQRALPTWAVLCSMSATELSAATFIGVPHAAFTGDWSYLQLAVGALLAKWLIARQVIPLYHRMQLVTVYGFLRVRFDVTVQRVAAACFVAGRVLASGVRLFIAALALAAVTDVPIEWAIVASGCVASLYTLSGGIRAVIWTDTLQGALLLIAALTTLVALVVSHPDGLGGILEWARAGGRTQILHTEPLISLTSGSALGVALCGGFFLTLATHSTDHDMVQRLLTTRDGERGGRALLGSALLNFPLTLLFLMIGTALAWFYSWPPGYDIEDSARILPLYALHELPQGLRGLLFAGLFAAAMSSLDSAICAIGTTWVTDVAPGPRSEEEQVRALRVASVVFGALLIAAALGMAQYHAILVERSSDGGGISLVDFALSSMTILYGGLLGIFALGLATRTRGSRRSVLAGLGCGAAVGLALFLHRLGPADWPRIAWAWWIPLAGSVTLAVAALGRSEPASDPVDCATR
jgi:SSS family transporter